MGATEASAARDPVAAILQDGSSGDSCVSSGDERVLLWVDADEFDEG